MQSQLLVLGGQSSISSATQSCTPWTRGFLRIRTAQPSILQEITHKATGVVLASHQEALPWLQAGHHPKDELAVLLLQHVNSDDFPDYHMNPYVPHHRCPGKQSGSQGSNDPDGPG